VPVPEPKPDRQQTRREMPLGNHVQSCLDHAKFQLGFLGSIIIKLPGSKNMRSGFHQLSVRCTVQRYCPSRPSCLCCGICHRHSRLPVRLIKRSSACIFQPNLENNSRAPTTLQFWGATQHELAPSAAVHHCCRLWF